MSNIAITDLHPTDFDLLPNSESYMRELSDAELNAKTGGFTAEDASNLFLGGLIGYAADLILTALGEWLFG